MKNTGKFIVAVTVIPLIVFGIIKGIRLPGKLCKGKDTDLTGDGNSAGKSVGQTIDAIIMKFSDVVDTIKNDDGKGEYEIDQALEAAKQELDKVAKSAKKLLARHA
jgi:hypothetical protein